VKRCRVFKAAPEGDLGGRKRGMVMEGSKMGGLGRALKQSDE
jgi:hypothetical protein